MAILNADAPQIVSAIGPEALLVEYGSGSCDKTRILLDQDCDWSGYVPIDISRSHLLASAADLAESYPDLEILPVCADYTADYTIPEPKRPVNRVVVFFPGSTIGNLEPDAAREFLQELAQRAGEGGGLLIGVDLHKDSSILEPAYDDAAGYSAAFALNVLEHINRELGADFDATQFRYESSYEVAPRRVRMGLESLSDQRVRIAGQEIELRSGEFIRTEYSHKFTLESFGELAASAGYSLEQVWTDPQDLFSVQLLRAL